MPIQHYNVIILSYLLSYKKDFAEQMFEYRHQGELTMKKSKRFIIGLVLLAVGIIGILGLFDDFSGELLLGSIVIVAIGGLLLWLDQKATSTEVAQPTQPTVITQTAPTPKKEEIPDGQKDYDLFFEYLEGQFLCYQYEQKICFIKDDNIEEKFGYVIGNGGKKLLFEFEPDNPYDSMAVAIYLDDKKLGYVYSGQTQEMIHSYHKQGRLICGYLNKYSVEEQTASYKIGFYNHIDYFDNKQFTLTKTNKKIDEYTSRADNLLNCDSGDLLLIEKEFLGENYIVTTDGYDEVGELPKSAISFIEEYCPDKIYGILNSCEEDENGKIKAKITVYLI